VRDFIKLPDNFFPYGLMFRTDRPSDEVIILGTGFRQDVEEVQDGPVLMKRREIMSTEKRNQKIVAGLKRGETFRAVAANVGVHHRTAQRVADRYGAYSARSKEAYESDFNTKGARVYRKARGL
jgi:hypothetical protein